MNTLPKENGIYNDDFFRPLQYEDTWYRHYRGYYIVTDDDNQIKTYEKKIDRIWKVQHTKDKLSDIWEYVKFIICVVLAFSAIAGAVILLAYLVNTTECKRIGTMMNIPYQYDFWAGCFLKYKDLWINHDQLFQLLGK